MAPRSSTLPEASTDSAREARKAFFCDLCQKGYARMPEFEAHENSYDHQHRKRLKEMRQITKDPSAAARQRAAEEKANAESGLKSIALGGSAGSGGGGKKKPVFKSTLQQSSSKPVEVVEAAPSLPLLDDLAHATTKTNGEVSAAQRRALTLKWLKAPKEDRAAIREELRKYPQKRKNEPDHALLQEYRMLNMQKFIQELSAAGGDDVKPELTEKELEEWERREREDLKQYGGLENYRDLVGK